VSVTGWQVDGTYVPCKDCGYIPPPENTNLPGVAWRSDETWHFNNCPTVPQLSSESKDRLRRTLDEMDEKRREATAEMARERSSKPSAETEEKGVTMAVQSLSGFKPEIAEKMKEAAAKDGMTVSGWVRYLVRKELERRGVLGG